MIRSTEVLRALYGIRAVRKATQPKQLSVILIRKCLDPRLKLFCNERLKYARQRVPGPAVLISLIDQRDDPDTGETAKQKLYVNPLQPLPHSEPPLA
jgi:hypothetical protein